MNPQVAQVINDINTFIIENHNNEITADILNPILIQLAELWDLVGDLDDLDTTDKSSIVNAINELYGLIPNIADNFVKKFFGSDNPNAVEPLGATTGDIYVRNNLDGDPYQTWIKLGDTWVQVGGDVIEDIYIRKETDFNLIENPTTGYANISETIRTIELSGVSSIPNDEFLGFNTPASFDITHDYVVTIKNATDKTLTIITNDSGADLPIILPNSQPSREFQIGEVLTFKIWEDLTYFELISSSIGGGGSLNLTFSEVLANGNIMDDQIDYDATDTIELGLFSKTIGDVEIEGVYLTTFTDPSGETFRPAIVRVELFGGVSKKYFIMGYQLSQGGMPTMKYIETDDNDDVVNSTEVHLGDNCFYVKGDKNLGFQGIRMHDDYSANYTDRCTIDKGYLASVLRIGTSVSFDRLANYGTITSPVNGNVTLNLTNAVNGMIQRMFHKSTSAVPTFPSSNTYVFGTYIVNSTNEITFEYIDGKTIIKIMSLGF